MSLTMNDSPERRPGDSDMHRRQRSKNLFIALVLLVLVGVFFGLTIVRMGSQMGVHQ